MPTKSIEAIQVTINIVYGVPTKESLKQLFFDEDFVTNEEEFREDTLELGFENEADRVLDELIEQDLEPIDLIQAIVDEQINSSGYYAESIVHTTTLEDLDIIVVSVSYMTTT